MHIRHTRPPLLIIGLIILGITLVIMIRQTFNRQVPPVESVTQVLPNAPFKLSSPLFDADGSIPVKFTCFGENINPPLAIQNPPGNTKSFALVMHDPDDSDGDRVHWLVWNIAPDTSLILENSSPTNSTQGIGESGQAKYEGPCPTKESGKHTYIFELYALNDMLSIPKETTRDSLITAMNGKVIAKVELTGSVQATP